MITAHCNILIITVALTACSSTGNKQSFGTLLGGAAGAFTASKFSNTSNRTASVALGTALGALIGYGVGRYLDDQGKQRLAAATVKTAETGKAQEIHDANTGTTLRTTQAPGAAKMPADGCQTVKQSVVLADGHTESEDVHLCKGPNGWEAA